MTRPTLTVTPRNETGKGFNRRLRSAGSVPAVVYTKGKAPVAVTADPKAVVAHLKGPLGRNGAVDLAIAGEGAPRLAMIHQYTVHPVKRSLEHIDFWEITPDTVLKMTVPFAGVGRSEAEKQGGRIRFTCDYIDVLCKPADAPEKIAFDMTALPVADANITISKLPLPAGVTAYFKHDYSVIQVTMPKVVAVEETAKGKDAKKGAKKK